jgi:hypothetical protein
VPARTVADAPIFATFALIAASAAGVGFEEGAVSRAA